MDEIASIAPATLAEWKTLDLPRKTRVAQILAELLAYLRGPPR
jgi:hypothetical protein